MGKRELLGRLSSGAVHMVFPPRCGVCGAWGRFLCSRCEAGLEPARPPRCSLCWRPLRQGETCDDHHEPALDGLRAAFVYDGVARDLVHGLKYRGMTALAKPMAELMALASWQKDFVADAVIPVPLTPGRMRTRGHNQAAVLSMQLARLLERDHLPNALRRRGHAPPQARSASANERRRNVAGAFVVPQTERITGRRIALVDDVTTTGSTLGACAVALRAAGAASVWGLAFARED